MDSANHYGVPKRSFRKALNRRSRIYQASTFTPQNPDITPEEHFPLQTVGYRAMQPRFVNRYDSREILIAVDGSCINNGSRDPVLRPSVGGCSFAFRGIGVSIAGPVTASPEGPRGLIGFPLEHSGPGGELHIPTSNRAKLRAVIAALEFRAWHGEGWRKIVIATDLQYVVMGATRWLAIWVRRGWRSRARRPVANRDLWEELHGIMESLAKSGTEVSFWLLPWRDAAAQGSVLVRATKEAAKEATTGPPDSIAQEFTRLCGIMI